MRGNTNGPRLGSCDRAIGYSGFFGVRETWVLLEISWIIGDIMMVYQQKRAENMLERQVEQPEHIELFRLNTSK